MTRQMMHFVIAGAIGFVVDAGILYVGLALGLGYFAGRLVSFLCAVFATWQVNRRLAFASSRGDSRWSEWWHYLVAMAFGGAINYAVYILVVVWAPKSAMTPLLAVAIGSGAAMTVNFLTAKFWVFRAR